jgi:hypothetical protein
MSFVIVLDKVFNSQRNKYSILETTSMLCAEYFGIMKQIIFNRMFAKLRSICVEQTGLVSAKILRMSHSVTLVLHVLRQYLYNTT